MATTPVTSLSIEELFAQAAIIADEERAKLAEQDQRSVALDAADENLKSKRQNFDIMCRKLGTALAEEQKQHEADRATHVTDRSQSDYIVNGTPADPKSTDKPADEPPQHRSLWDKLSGGHAHDAEEDKPTDTTSTDKPAEADAKSNDTPADGDASKAPAKESFLDRTRRYWAESGR